MAKTKYTEEDIKTLEWREHIRLRPGMYIGKRGDGSAPDDGIYVLLKEVIDNCIDEFVMGHGKVIEVKLDGDSISVRDFGRGIPLGKLMDCAAKINTGAKYDSEAFQKSVGLNGVGIKAVNALSENFQVQAFREGKTKSITFSKAEVTNEMQRARSSKASDGTFLSFQPDEDIFNDFKWREEFIENMLWNYAYLNSGLTLVFNGKKYKAKEGLKELLEKNLSEEPLYPVAHLIGNDIEVAITHSSSQYGEEYYSFVNGQHTTQGGSHQAAFREAVVKTVRDHFKKTFDPSDIRQSIIGAISVKIQEPVFESQTKTKLGSTHTAPKDGLAIRGWIVGFVQDQLDNYLHRNPDAAKAMLEKIQRAEKERKDLKGIRKLAKERAKKAKIHNKKLRDCRVHYGDRNKKANDSTLFITEGDSASGSITTARDVDTQAVFSLRGKPLNSFGLSKKVVYENEEFNLLQHALDIEDGLERLRYNNVVLATDADVDGMHIRLLLITFFLQFFPELIREGHLYILDTPLFRVRNKQKQFYCYNERERAEAIESCGKGAEITRFKGLGEISPGEFKEFIGDGMKLDPVILDRHKSESEMLQFYMGKNTPDRQKFIIDNLKVEMDLLNEEEVA
ncbi:MAG: DNA topoisomerase IV subunit B [Verrucomicrobiales bacterium]|jgi:topoisomerase-4 subunit B|nr:DNA topoisomerase IV subunit B [Verrucomicrobiales bacterium]MEC7357658.1 DNA topoisomerase IV subunit B [Verrucomicrobiota bacterium]